MPIYEFKCLKCNNFFELLVMGSNDQAQITCPKCHSEEFERVLSTASFAMSGGSNNKQGVTSQTRSCSSGSCTTYTIPGPNG
jgi:putative FmdB family regulatory protein